jgi:uncharacterized protein HemY
VRDPAEAVEHARRAVDLAPQQGGFYNTLGVAQYRAGDWQGAVDALGRSMELAGGGSAFDWFFLAMAHWQLGQQDLAREWFEKAVLWMDERQPDNEELGRFRAEAEELLGLAGPAFPVRVDVPAEAGDGE